MMRGKWVSVRVEMKWEEDVWGFGVIFVLMTRRIQPHVAS